jgi:hypothetical protein
MERIDRDDRAIPIYTPELRIELAVLLFSGGT